MLRADFSLGYSAVRTEGAYRYDTGRTLCVSGVEGLGSDAEVHFDCGEGSEALVKVGRFDPAEQTLTVEIPNLFFEQANENGARAWVYIPTDGGDFGYTVKTVYIPIKDRLKPDNYVLPDDESSMAQVRAAMLLHNRLEADETLIALKANSSDVTAALALKANAADVYTKTEADAGFASKTGFNTFVTETYADDMTDLEDAIDLKANSSDVAAALALKADAAEVGENIARLNSGWHDFDIDYGELTAGYVKGTNGGIVESHSTLKRTGYIDLSSYNIKKLTFPQFYSGSLAGYAFFDSAQTFISGGILGEATEGSAITVTIPSSAKYVMISVKNANAASFYLKGSVNVFDNADPTLTKAGRAADAKATGDRLTRLNSGWHDFDIDYGTLTVGYVNGTNGSVASSHNTLKRTDYIDLSSSNINKLTFPQFYSGTAAGYAFFDSAQTFLSGGVLGEATEGSATTVTIPSSAKYVMISVKNANAASFYLKGSMYIFDAIGESEENEDPLNIDPNKSLFSIFQHIGVIGDSLSSGYFNAPSNGSVPAATLTRYEYSWIQQLARRLGIEAFNFSKGGLSTRTWFTSDDGAYPAMLTDGEHDCEAYFIALCHNDYNNSIPIGTESDAESLADTFYGNYSRIIKTIQDYSPCAKIFLITAKDVSTFEAYNAAMRYMTTIYTKNVYVLDMAVYGGGTDVPSWMKTGAHGNAMGYLLYSRWIESLTSWYIMNHPDEFKYVQFINTIREENIPASQNASLT